MTCPCPGCKKRPTLGVVRIESQGAYSDYLLGLPVPVTANLGAWRRFQGMSDEAKGRGIRVPISGVEQDIIFGHHDSGWMMRRKRRKA